MKKTFLFIIIAIAFTNAKAQIATPVKWTYTAKKINAVEYELHITAALQPKWHIYSQDIKADGPVPTSILLDKNPLVKINGTIGEVGKLEKSFDKNFNATLKYYQNKVDFVQKVSLKSAANTIIKGKLTYMLCNDEKCLAPTTVPFSIKLSNK